MTLDLKALNALLGELGPEVQKGNEGSADTPVLKSVDADAAAQPYGRHFYFLSKDDSIFIQRKLNTLSWEEKGYLLERQVKAGEGSGIPLQVWQQQKMLEALEEGGIAIPTNVLKALDTSGGSALIRQDLDPFIVSMFVSIFPAWQRINKTPANGLVHAWDQLTAYATDTTTSSFISELGTVVDKTGQYTRATRTSRSTGSAGACRSSSSWPSRPAAWLGTRLVWKSRTA